MVGWHQRLNGHEFEPALGDGEGLGILACCSSQGRRESDMTQQLNTNNFYFTYGSVYVGVRGGRQVQEGEDMCILMADSCWCMAETNTMFLTKYPSIKNKILKRDSLVPIHFLPLDW